MENKTPSTRIVAKWFWKDKNGKSHPCIRTADGAEFVIEKIGRRSVLRPIKSAEERLGGAN